VHKGRLEAFSDAVIAIIMTIMVLELHAPLTGELQGLHDLLGSVGSYALSFVFLAIYWNNHHHMMQRCKHVTGLVLWANMHLLFWLSFIPFSTAWMGKSGYAQWPVALYGVVLFMAAVAYFLLTRALLSAHGTDSDFARALGKDVKGKISLVIYAAAIGLSFVQPAIACACYVLVALIWFVPDKRFEQI
jgi:uncharacterized membrane protein